MWYNRFKEGREDVNDDARPGRPTTSATDENIEAVTKMILDNCRITAREVAADSGISFGSCQAIFTDILGMKRAAVKIVSKLLNFEQKSLKTGDESWMYGYVLKANQISAMEASRRAKAEKSTSSSVKCESFGHCFLQL